MNEHFIVAVDRGELRIYTETTAPGCDLRRLELVDPAEYRPRESAYTDRVLAFGSRSGRSRSGSDGALVLEAEPLRPETTRRTGRQLARELDAFLSERHDASWDFAAPSALYHSIVEALSPGVRRRLKRVFSNANLTSRLTEQRSELASVWSAGGR